MKRERGSTIERVLDILDTVAASTKPLSATEINEALDLPKATAHGFAPGSRRGVPAQENRRENLSARQSPFRRCCRSLASSRFGATRRAILTELSEKVGETCNIAYPMVCNGLFRSC